MCDSWTMTDSPDWTSRPRLRAGDADRQQAIERLTAAWRAGQLDTPEFRERTNTALEAIYVDDLDILFADLGTYQTPPGQNPPDQALAQPAPGEVVQDSWHSDPDALPARYAAADEPDDHVTIGVMSGQERFGRWVVAPTHLAVGFWGGALIDLREAVFTQRETTITCFGIMGGVEIIVPPDMNVRLSGFGFMGGFGWERLDDARPAGQPDPDAPQVVITGLGFWGGVSVRRLQIGEPLRRGGSWR